MLLNLILYGTQCSDLFIIGIGRSRFEQVRIILLDVKLKS